MTETTAPATLADLKIAALARRLKQTRLAQEAEQARADELLLEWTDVMAAVRRDHPYLMDGIDDKASGFADAWAKYEELAETPSRAGELTKAVIGLALPGHVPIACKYERSPRAAEESLRQWVQMPFAGRDSDWRVPTEWHVALDHPEGVESGSWAYTAELGEALLLAEESYKEKCQKTQEAVKRRQEKAAKPKGLPLTRNDRVALAAYDLFAELRDQLRAEEAEAEELGIEF